MTNRILVIAEESLPKALDADCRTLAAQLADYVGESAGLMKLSRFRMRLYEGLLLAGDAGEYIQELQPNAALTVPQPSAVELVWRDDGRPDWGAMWRSFCELALYGGPPSRGDADALLPVEIDGAADAFASSEAVCEVCRGIAETTGLHAEAVESGWIAVACDSPKMAAWLSAAILLENVYARCDGTRLLLPVSPTYRVEREVAGTIEVVAKTNHYWQAHLAAQQARADEP